MLSGASASGTGSEADLFGGARMVPNVLRAMSLVPDSVRNMMMLSESMYIGVEYLMTPGKETGRAIDRVQTELVAGRVSSINECFY